MKTLILYSCIIETVEETTFVIEMYPYCRVFVYPIYYTLPMCDCAAKFDVDLALFTFPQNLINLFF